MDQFIISNQWLILLLMPLAILWSLCWKGVALWRAARREEKWWFIALLLINTLGLLEILYIFVFSRKKKDNQSQNL